MERPNPLWQHLWRPVLLALVATGCIWVVLTPSDNTETNAAFGLLGVIVASIVKGLD